MIGSEFLGWDGRFKVKREGSGPEAAKLTKRARKKYERTKICRIKIGKMRHIKLCLRVSYRSVTSDWLKRDGLQSVLEHGYIFDSTSILVAIAY